MVFLLGALIIVTGVTIPDSMDAWMGRIVGSTLIVLVLGAWVLGLMLANSGLAVLACFGLLRSGRSFAVYATVAVVVGLPSIVVGLFFVIGVETLPAMPT